MKKALVFLATILFVLPLYCQEQGQREVAIVINMAGAKVYERPAFGSDTLTVLHPGAILIVERRIETREKLQLGEGFYLTGEWIKARGTEGFIFSSDLSSKQVSTGRNEFGEPFIDLLGNLVREEKEEKDVMTPEGEFPRIVVTRYYENGTFSITAWDGCYDLVTEYKGLALNEVYHQMVSDHGLFMSDGEYEIPQFTEKVEHKLRFGSIGANQDLTLELKEDGAIVVSSYNCD